MSEAQDFHRFLNGDLRVDGFQSPWLKKTLADRAEQERRRVAPVVRKCQGTVFRRGLRRRCSNEAGESGYCKNHEPKQASPTQKEE